MSYIDELKNEYSSVTAKYEEGITKMRSMQQEIERLK